MKKLGFVNRNQYSSGLNTNRPSDFRHSGSFISYVGKKLVDLNFIEGMDKLLSEKDGNLRAVSLSVYGDFGPIYRSAYLSVSGKERDGAVDEIISRVFSHGTKEMHDFLQARTGFKFGRGIIEAVTHSKDPELAQHIVDSAVKTLDKDNLNGFINQTLYAATNKVISHGLGGEIEDPQPKVIDLIVANFGKNGKYPDKLTNIAGADLEMVCERSYASEQYMQKAHEDRAYIRKKIFENFKVPQEIKDNCLITLFTHNATTREWRSGNLKGVPDFKDVEFLVSVGANINESAKKAFEQSIAPREVWRNGEMTEYIPTEPEFEKDLESFNKTGKLFGYSDAELKALLLKLRWKN